MNRAELIEKVARAIFETWAIANEAGGTWDELLLMQKRDGYITAKELYDLALEEASAAIDTIFAAMKEPTIEMIEAHGEYASYPFSILGYDAMLNASPLAPEGGRG